MDDKTYEKTKAEIKELVNKWVKILKLDNYIITSEYSRGVCHEAPDRAAITRVYWDYQEATITFYLDLMTDAYKSMEHVVVHELVHILLAPEQANLSDEYNQQMEFTTECVTLRLLAMEKELNEQCDLVRRQKKLSKKVS